MLLTGFHGSCYARSVYIRVQCHMCVCVCVCASIKEMIACANMAVTMSNKSGSGAQSCGLAGKAILLLGFTRSNFSLLTLVAYWQ